MEDGSLNTFISEWIEIDKQEGSTGNADLFDDDAVNPDLPLGGGGYENYIDWHELVTTDGMVDEIKLANHQKMDGDPTARVDGSIFPQANSCIGEGGVLDKMDLTFASIANNDSFVFLGVQRKKNNGDAAYYWLFTKEAPKLVSPSADNSCKSNTDLLYDLSKSDGGSGDVLVRGLFRPSADEPALEVFQAQDNFMDVPAVDIIDIELEIGGKLVWAPYVDPTPDDETDDLVVAVNTTPTAPGALGALGVVSMDGSNIGEHIFAEAAVPLLAFTGGSSCGETYHASVLSRPSHSPTSDPKDLIGPFPVNFGSTEVTATLTPSCTTETGYHATALGSDGNAIPEEFLDCSWDFGGGLTSSDCSGTIVLPEGMVNATVVVSDTRNDCGDSGDVAATVYEALSVQVGAQDACTDPTSMGICATITGGSGMLEKSWSFSGPGTMMAPEMVTTCDLGYSVATADMDGAYSAMLSIVDTGRADGRTDCMAMDSAGATAYAPLMATLTPAGGMCIDAASFDVTELSGGDGGYQFLWTPNCGMDASCEIDLSGELCPSGSVQVTISDGSVCDSIVRTGSYSKTTNIVAEVP